MVLTLWMQLDKFPIQFHPLACLHHHDETHEVLEMLTKLTTQLKYVFRELNSGRDGGSHSPRALQKELADFFYMIQPRGIATCLGLRKTPSSIDEELPPIMNQLILQFNRMYTVLTEE